eukprot:1160373-Pelagomonas_calceolata.AAC.15
MLRLEGVIQQLPYHGPAGAVQIVVLFNHLQSTAKPVTLLAGPWCGRAMVLTAQIVVLLAKARSWDSLTSCRASRMQVHMSPEQLQTNTPLPPARHHAKTIKHRHGISKTAISLSWHTRSKELGTVGTHQPGMMWSEMSSWMFESRVHDVAD